MYDNILIPTDGTDETLDAVVPGIELAAEHGATVHLLYVVENRMLRTLLSPRSMRTAAVETRTTGERAVADLQTVADRHGVETISWVLRGPPSLVYGAAHETIVEYAETNGVDLIVMGSTDRGWMSTMLRPSLTQRVMTSTDVPVHGRRLSKKPQYGSEQSDVPGTGSETSD
jgi:nucleotide-binding universal stress UspA family protein